LVSRILDAELVVVSHLYLSFHVRS
jgi:hypothetical protein